MKYLIFGNGYLGNKFKERLGKEARLTTQDIGNLEGVRRELKKWKSRIVINCAAQTGKPNVDWCEDHKLETIYSNITGPEVLAKACFEQGARLVHLGTGCMYQGGESIGGYTEEHDPDPNQIPSFYSWTKYMAEQILSHYPTLQLRIRMPIDGEFHPRNLINKITNYKKVVDVPNSVTVIPDMIEATLKLIALERTGIYNIVNPGTLKYSDLLKHYREIVDPTHHAELIGIEELLKLTKTGRSNCVLSSKKLQKDGIYLKPISERVPEILYEYKKNKDKQEQILSEAV